MVISIDDKLYARYKEAADSVKFPGGTEALIVRQLARMSDYAASARLIILDKAPLQQIEVALGGGSLRSADDLVERIKAYASISLGGVRMDLSPAQLEEVAYRAQKLGKAPDEMLKEMVQQIEGLVFHTGEASYR